MSYKQRFNRAFNFDEDEEHSSKVLSNITCIPLRILKEVYNRGEGAHSSNLSCVRI
jgi:hypothetical protein